MVVEVDKKHSLKFCTGGSVLGREAVCVLNQFACVGNHVVVARSEGGRGLL